MDIQPRAYRDNRDLENMRQLLVTGKKANNGSYYVHPGDLDWWLNYLSQENKRQKTIFLWEDSQKDCHLLGWTLLSPEWNAVDVFAHPDLRGTQMAHQMWNWSVNCLTELVSSQKAQRIRTMWIDEKDEAMIEVLKKLDFQKSDNAMHYLECELPDLTSINIDLPQGYEIRGNHGEKELEKRAVVSYAAFESEKPFEQYKNRYLNFMHSSVYETDRDLVIVAPDGNFAGFCLIWLDYENLIGLFEPVGIHPKYQKRGLGKALMLAGKQKMRRYGMQKAMVCAEHENTPAFKLYQAVGFKPLKVLRTYIKELRHQKLDG